MLRFSANIEYLFTELPFMDRFSAAKQAGFAAVEFMFPFERGLEEVYTKLNENDLKLVLFNLPAGNWEKGDRGIAADPARRDEFRAGVEVGLKAAKKLGVPRVNCLAGKKPDAATDEEVWQNLVDNVRYAAALLEKANIKLVVEPINHFDMPGFYLNTSSQGLKLISEVSHPNVYLQYDIYHGEREGEDHLAVLGGHISQIGHMQLADSPGRHQPGTGHIDFTALLKEIDKLAYGGYIGLEYIPKPDTENSLKWVFDYGYGLSEK